MKGLLSFLANLLLFLSISTLVFSIAAFVAFKIKGKRKPKSGAAAKRPVESAEPELLQPYVQNRLANDHAISPARKLVTKSPTRVEL